MPALLTHHYFAQTLIESYQKKYPFLGLFSSLVWLGAQGPDPFFFYGHAPFKKRLETSSINQWGTTLHNQNPEQSLAPLLKQFWWNVQTEPEEKAYLVGALSHYVLDRICHPFVFYWSGFDEHGQLSKPYGYQHARWEVSIDVALLDALKLDPTKYQPKETLSIHQRALIKISEGYHQAFPKPLNHEHFLQAVEDMKATYRYLYHPHLFKQLLIRLLTGPQSLALGLIHPRRISEQQKNLVLNLRRKKWLHPLTGIPSQLTFLQLIEEGKMLFAQAMKLLAMPRYEPLAWQSFFESIDYDGKPTGETLKLWHGLRNK